LSNDECRLTNVDCFRAAGQSQINNRPFDNRHSLPHQNHLAALAVFFTAFGFDLDAIEVDAA
jgi:hypothetical protein